MSDMSALEKICYPVFQCVCNYWQLCGITNAVDMEKFERDIIQALRNAKTEAEQSPELSREFAWVEKPLVFFIDYMVKEGRFPFSGEWRELSRNYNELSGDEKFFDLLFQTLEEPNCRNSFALFYIMLGLGFDGAYRFNQDYIRQCMQLCREKSRAGFDISVEPLTPPPKKKSFFQRRRGWTLRTTIIAAAVFMALCFLINLAVFAGTTQKYRAILEKTQSTAAEAVKGGR